jgi:hypothetical protein
MADRRRLLVAVDMRLQDHCHGSWDAHRMARKLDGGCMAGIPRGRRVGRAAVNAVRSLLEDHDHIVQEIDGQNDFGEDLYVTFSDKGKVTGDVVKIQVKGGKSWRRANGYYVPIEQHADTWSEGNIPVLCVVYDPETEGLYWANATAQLQKARRAGIEISAIGISASARLDRDSIAEFTLEARRFAGKYAGRARGMRAIRAHLGELAGVDFESSDIVLNTINDAGEILVFSQRIGEEVATLFHSDLDWEPRIITPDDLSLSEEFVFTSKDGKSIGIPLVGDTILSFSELLWLASCFSSTRWAREYVAPEDADASQDEHGSIDADVADQYIIEQILDRLEVQPGLLEESIKEMHRSARIDVGMLDELGQLESDSKVVREVMSLSRTNVQEISFEALRLALIYLVDRIYIGSPSLPIEQQINIVWRVPEDADSAAESRDER